MADSESIEFKARITDRTPADDNTKDTEIAIPLKYLNTLRVTLNIPLIKYEINTWYKTLCFSSFSVNTR